MLDAAQQVVTVLDWVAVGGDDCAMSVGQVEIIDLRDNVIGVRPYLVNGERVVPNYMVSCHPSECAKIADQKGFH